jgi:symplekin
MGSVDPSTLQQLAQARNAALENVALYPQVMGPVVGLVTENPSLELQRWTAEFIAEAMSSPSLAADEKERMGLTLLPVIKSFLEVDHGDTVILKGSIQAAASLYPLVFRYM